MSEFRYKYFPYNKEYLIDEGIYLCYKVHPYTMILEPRVKGNIEGCPPTKDSLGKKWWFLKLESYEACNALKILIGETDD